MSGKFVESCFSEWFLDDNVVSTPRGIADADSFWARDVLLEETFCASASNISMLAADDGLTTRPSSSEISPAIRVFFAAAAV